MENEKKKISVEKYLIPNTVIFAILPCPTGDDKCNGSDLKSGEFKTLTYSDWSIQDKLSTRKGTWER